MYLLESFTLTCLNLLQEDVIESAGDDWAHDVRNPRNWGFWKKWQMVAIVSI